MGAFDVDTTRKIEIPLKQMILLYPIKPYPLYQSICVMIYRSVILQTFHLWTMQDMALSITGATITASTRNAFTQEDTQGLILMKKYLVHVFDGGRQINIRAQGRKRIAVDFCPFGCIASSA